MSDFVVYEALTIDTLDEEMNNIHPMALKAITNPDTMYLHQALKQPIDCKQFMEVMDEEIKVHMEGKQRKIVPCSQVPTESPILPAMWN